MLVGGRSCRPSQRGAILLVSEPGLLSEDYPYPKALRRFLEQYLQDPQLAGSIKDALEKVAKSFPDSK